MKVTTLRFGQDLWTLLEHEASLTGVSVSQYVREAALARAAASAGARGDAPFEALVSSAREVASTQNDVERRHEIELALASLARALAAAERDSSEALTREAQQGKKRSVQLREDAVAMRRAGPH